VRAGRASLPLVRFTAPPSTSLRASTPGGDPKIVSIGPRLPHRESRSALVVSHHLDGLLRSELAGLLHPAIDPGVRRVSDHRLPRAAEAARWRAGNFPATHTPRRTSSRLQPYRVTAAVASLPFPLPLAAPSQGLRSEPGTFPIGALARAPKSTLPPLQGDRQGRWASRPCSVDETVTSSGPLLVPGRPVLHGLLVPSKVPLAARTRWNAPGKRPTPLRRGAPATPFRDLHRGYRRTVSPVRREPPGDLHDPKAVERANPA
jgi:hypothetical protein